MIAACWQLTFIALPESACFPPLNIILPYFYVLTFLIFPLSLIFVSLLIFIPQLVLIFIPQLVNSLSIGKVYTIPKRLRHYVDNIISSAKLLR